MSDFQAKSLCILGRQPALGLAELESLYGADHVRSIPKAAVLDISASDINFKRLGGTVKTARVLAQLPYSEWKPLADYLMANIPKHLDDLPAGKFTLGLSVYGIKVSAFEINKVMLAIKKIVKKDGRSVRVVPNKTAFLSSAQVLHNKLTHRGSWELILIAAGQSTILAQTLFVQDIEDYASRDQARPARDPKIGMLPPKLAQIIINLSLPRLKDQKTKITILDPFCGTGVILQEALLMGYDVIGTDIDERMTNYAKTNILWLRQKYPQIAGRCEIMVADATKFRWSKFSTVASEVYLGQALSKLPSETALEQIIIQVNEIIEKFLKNLWPQLHRGQKICLAIPAWQISSDKFQHLPLIANLTDMGYNRISFEHTRIDKLVYFRKNQIVAREILVLTKA